MVTRDPNAGNTTSAAMKDMAQQGKETVKGSAEKAREQVYHLKDQVQEQTKSVVMNQKSRAADNLHGMADGFRQMSEQMREKDQNYLSQYIDRAADQIERVSEYMRESDINDLIDDAQQLARRQPAIFVGGAFALGFLMARFLKSSSRGTGSMRGYSHESDWRPGRFERHRTEQARWTGETYGGATPSLREGDPFREE